MSGIAKVSCNGFLRLKCQFQVSVHENFIEDPVILTPQQMNLHSPCVGAAFRHAGIDQKQHAAARYNIKPVLSSVFSK